MSWPVPERRDLLIQLATKRVPYKEIADIYGGTPDGVRSTIRKYRERGLIPERVEWPIP